MSLTLIKRPLVVIGCALLTLSIIFPVFLKASITLIIATVAIAITGFGLLATIGVRMHPYIDEDVAASRIIEFEPPGTASSTFHVVFVLGIILGVASAFIAGIVSSFAISSMIIAGVVTFTISTSALFFTLN